MGCTHPGGAWDTLSRDCGSLASLWATEEPNPIHSESANTTAQLPNSRKRDSPSFSLSCCAVGQLSWRTHYGQAFATLWGVQSQSAAISCQASRAVEGQASQHKAIDHPTNLEEPRRALSVTTDRIFVRQKDVPEKQKKKRSSTKPLITLVRGRREAQTIFYNRFEKF